MATGHAGRPKLPALNAGSNLISGTYLAEQISAVSYDLVSATASRNRSGKVGAMSPAVGLSKATKQGLMRRLENEERKKTSEKLVKCTQLLALDREDKDHEDKAVPEFGALPSGGLGKVSESSSSEEDDVDFKRWLTLPKIGQTPRDTPVEGSSRWHILLSHKTFRAHTEEHVSKCLMHVLGLDAHSAYEKLKESRKQRLVVLEETTDKGDAFRKLQKFRSLGLQVQVTLDYGLPVNGSNKLLRNRPPPPTAGPRRRSYTQCFYTASSVAGPVDGTRAWGAGDSTAGGSTAMRMQMCHAKVMDFKKQDGLAHWRSAQTGFQEQDVLPEDPVAELFLQERHTEKRSRSAGGFLRSMICKHQKELQAMAFREREMSLFSHIVDQAASHDALPFRHPSIAEYSKSRVVSQSKKEACMLMRFLVLGFIGNEDAKDKDAMFHETIGPKEQVGLFQQTWKRLDIDGSGRVDGSEFRVFVEKEMRDRIDNLKPAELEHLAKPKGERRTSVRRQTNASIHSISPKTQSASDFLAQAVEDVRKFTHVFCEKVNSALLGKKSSFAMEDMMRSLWLSATQADMRIMRSWCREFVVEAMKERVKTPPVLEKADSEALCSVFDHFDEDRHGEIMLNTLVTKGLIYQDQIEDVLKQWDQDGNGLLSREEFCDMMCPFGFRSTSKSEVGSQLDGSRIFYDNTLGCWKLQDEAMNVSFEVRGSSKEQLEYDDLLS